MPSLRTFHNALNAPPTTTNGVGGGYSFFVNNVLKFGKSNKPWARKDQWKRQCREEQQTWLDFHWEVPYAKKFERIIHIKLKRLGAWLGRVHCRFCGRNHQEKFDLRKCGGKAGLVRIIEARLNTLGWIWRSSKGPIPMFRSLAVDTRMRKGSAGKSEAYLVAVGDLLDAAGELEGTRRLDEMGQDKTEIRGTVRGMRSGRTWGKEVGMNWREKGGRGAGEGRRGKSGGDGGRGERALLAEAKKNTRANFCGTWGASATRPASDAGTSRSTRDIQAAPQKRGGESRDAGGESSAGELSRRERRKKLRSRFSSRQDVQ
ncbi:hypothetical protein DFH08DRAFT_820869 [Mycena albidolilacea]|uniref:Bacteriophage T5 Orf172 DNA-binding domain-containing protein n=1 Tax=Mycena albidolilacea TaxID=1033008 RepID=A0AAD6ZBN0_9AGAR|nr:hypothetical protein DFH08DRAFT_820869 [Mycena albidolilacea]